MDAFCSDTVIIKMTLEEAIALRNILGQKPFPVSSKVHDFWETLDGVLAARGYRFVGPPDV